MTGGANRLGSRGVLGDGRAPVPADIPRANRLADAVMTGAAVLAVGVAALRR